MKKALKYIGLGLTVVLFVLALVSKDFGEAIAWMFCAHAEFLLMLVKK